ncbi:hypothetical protein KI809_17745 [Geobacter pelophilus]|uniref:Uncharacterized protein n=1 Tax=Geoanaerobacter pelophilus TaxID=60036 RepID=A0AAW4LAP3_9BACT|nr:hypothetical protein [Geoanaerobacter pelophilus]MBT0666158.1 hypothetical protein [Geoanaerobacter pelophilus]
MQNHSNMHTLTHTIINDLQQAFSACSDHPTEGLILSAIVTVKQVHDLLPQPESAMADLDPEEYCCAI